MFRCGTAAGSRLGVYLSSEAARGELAPDDACHCNLPSPNHQDPTVYSLRHNRGKEKESEIHGSTNGFLLNNAHVPLALMLITVVRSQNASARPEALHRNELITDVAATGQL